MSEESLQIAEQRREAKGTGEKEGYIHLNAEFQRTARRDKKAFLGDQCKEVDENNRMRKTRDLFKRIRDTKGAFHAKISTIKDRNGMDLTEVEHIKKRWQEYTELCKKGLHNSDNHFSFLHFFFVGTVLITASCTVSQTSVHSSSGTLSDLVP